MQRHTIGTIALLTASFIKAKSYTLIRTPQKTHFTFYTLTSFASIPIFLIAIRARGVTINQPGADIGLTQTGITAKSVFKIATRARFVASADVQTGGLLTQTCLATVAVTDITPRTAVQAVR